MHKNATRASTSLDSAGRSGSYFLGEFLITKSLIHSEKIKNNDMVS